MLSIQNCMQYANQPIGIIGITALAGGFIGQTVLDSRVSSFMQGFGLIGTGLAIFNIGHLSIGKKSAARIIKNKASKQRTGKEFTWLIKAAGIGLISLGVYWVAKEILYPSQILNPRLSYERDFSPYFKSKIEQAKKNFMKCDGARELWDKMNAETPITITGVTPETCPTGACVFKSKIMISEDIDDFEFPHLETTILFELNNIVTQPQDDKVWDRVCQMPVEEFAETLERIEYTAAIGAHQIASKCIASGQWRGISDPFQDKFSGKFSTEPYSDWRNINNCLTYQDKTGHTDGYRRAWYRACKPQDLQQWEVSAQQRLESNLRELNALKRQLEQRKR